MPAILTSNVSAIEAALFVNAITNGGSNLYLAIARDDEYPWDDEDTPPTPLDTVQEENELREKIIGIVRAHSQNVMLMVPRVDWAVGEEFNLMDETLPGTRKALDYYCLTSNNMVYQCVGKSDDGILTTEGGEPDLMIPNQSTIDGYTWKFMYDITTQMVNDGMLLDAWMPVPFNYKAEYPGGTLTENQYYYGDPHANWTLGAFRVLVVVELGNMLPDITYDVSFRQIALILDPQDSEGNYLAGQWYNNTQFDINSGQLFYIENRKVVNRTEGQTELAQALLCF